MLRSRLYCSSTGPVVSLVKIFTWRAELLRTGIRGLEAASSAASDVSDSQVLYIDVASIMLLFTLLRSSLSRVISNTEGEIGDRRTAPPVRVKESFIPVSTSPLWKVISVALKVSTNIVSEKVIVRVPLSRSKSKLVTLGEILSSMTTVAWMALPSVMAVMSLPL